MKIAPRMVLSGIALALLLLAGIVFRLFLFENFIRPAAIVLWVIWQILLSFDQRVLWGLCAFLAAALAVYRLGHIELPRVEQSAQPDPNASLARVRYWQTSILWTTDEIEKPNILKLDLVQMLVSVYAVRQPDTPRLEINRALRLRQIALPEPVYAFLFPADHTDSKQSIGRIMRSLWQAPQKWARRRTGRDIADYYSSIEDVLTLIEAALEITHDDRSFDDHTH